MKELLKAILESKKLAVTIVAMNSKTICFAPRLNTAPFTSAGATSLGTANDIIAAGTRKLTTDGTKRARNVQKSTSPRCQTINVVMSPNGLNAPPAFAATTILIQATATKRG